jgi:ATP:corrinoid adenosyltransferase
LRCPDSLAVKNRLKENKDKLLHKSIEWIFNDEQYNSWQHGDNVSLLWIKGGAGKGKTMMSIGLIEKLSGRPKDATVVTYFFCQNADYELNTVEAIIKGLILRLLRQQEVLKKVLRDRWDTVNERFSEDVTSWRGLWNVFLEMLDSCKSSRVIVIVDALDECQNDGMADLLKLIVRTGLSRSSQLKWLLTSRPLDVAERELLAGSEQVMVSLELNAEHISQGVATYISSKVSELDHRHHYGQTLRRELEEELVRKSEDTFLWVNLVCKELENVDRDQVMTTTRDLPPGLPSYYHQILIQLCEGELYVVTGCVRLLKVMMLTYRPLNVCEVSSVSGLSEEELSTDMLVDRCASFVNMRGNDIEFVHQSARDYLAGNSGQSVLGRHDQYGHGEIVMSCLSHLSRQLKVNLLHLPRPDSTREKVKVMKGDDANEVLTSLDYAATLWVRHLAIAKHTSLVQNALADDGTISKFLSAKLLEWLECLSLLEKLPRAIEALQTLKDVVDVSDLYVPLQDRFLTMALHSHRRTLS